MLYKAQELRKAQKLQKAQQLQKAQNLLIIKALNNKTKKAPRTKIKLEMLKSLHFSKSSKALEKLKKAPKIKTLVSHSDSPEKKFIL